MVAFKGSAALGAGEIREFIPKLKFGELIWAAGVVDAAAPLCDTTFGFPADAANSDFERRRSNSK
eukprot:3421597-Karenia_brevis.AAC.1